MIENRKNRTYETSLYEFAKNSTIRFDKYQRSYDWEVEQVSDITDEIFKLASYTKDKRDEYKINLLTFAVYNGNAAAFIADGHSRITTFNLATIAVNDYILANNLNVTPLATFNMNYMRSNCSSIYNEFIQNHVCNSNKYSIAYKFIYRQIVEFMLVRRHSINDLIDVLTNSIFVTIKECSSKMQAHQYFEQINTGGKPLTKNEIITSFIEYSSDEFGLEITYNESELENALKSYYYMKRQPKVSSFNGYVIRKFMLNSVCANEVVFEEFQSYMDRLDAFRYTSWYTILSALNSDKTMRVAYSLVGMGHDLSGKDEDVNNLLSSLVAFCVISTARGSNTGSVMNNMFDDILIDIAANKTVEEVYERNLLAFVKKNPNKNKITISDLDASLDKLRECQQNAILLYSYWHFNKGVNLAYERYEVEHCYPENASREWLDNGWPKSKEAKNELLRSIGNQLLLTSEANKEASNQYLTGKNPIYTDFFNNHRGLKETCNYFSCSLFAKERMTYIEKRRRSYANLLASLPIAVHMVVK